MRVGVREFKNRATELLRLVESAGTEIVVTRHRRPIARVIASRKRPQASEQEALARLARLGLVRPGDGKPFSKAWRPIRASGKPGSEMILEEREDRF